MPKKTKDSVAISMRLEKTVYERLRAYAEDKGQTYTTALERIITAYLDEREQKLKEKEER